LKASEVMYPKPFIWDLNNKRHIMQDIKKNMENELPRSTKYRMLKSSEGENMFCVYYKPKEMCHLELSVDDDIIKLWRKTSVSMAKTNCL
jgi:hypothetical protein